MTDTTNNFRQALGRPSTECCQKSGGSLFAALPDAVLEITVSYLAKPSRALLAIAIGEIECYSEIGNAIIRKDDWSSLNFGDIENDLAGRLTDDHMNSMLTCIDATNILKSLKIHGCTSIEGNGLEPLRHSTAIKRLDLVVTKNREDPFMLTEDKILPIIDDIMVQTNPTMEIVQLPMNWENGYASEAARNFAMRYNQYKLSRRRKCSNFKPGVNDCIDENDGEEEVLCKDVCYSCLSPFHECCPNYMFASFQEIDANRNLSRDDSCHRIYCDECYKTNVLCCSWCGDGPWNGGDKKYCNECSPHEKCVGCGDSACRCCARLYFKQCTICHKKRCTSCVYFEAWRRFDSSRCYGYDSVCEDCLDSNYLKENYWKLRDDSDGGSEEEENEYCDDESQEEDEHFESEEENENYDSDYSGVD